MSFFSSFFLYKIREQEDGTGLAWEAVAGTNGKGEERKW
jgi:hypothetical protein